MKYRITQVAIARASVVAMCIASATAVAQVAESNYRENQPPTLNDTAERHAAADAERANVAADFKSAYANARRPKIALLWHRELNDSISATREASAQVTSQGALPEHNYDVKIKVESKGGAVRAYSLAPPPRAAEFESGFQSALRDSGVQFVDRNTIIRLSASRSAQGAKDLDYQSVEMSALSEYAEYFAEINFIDDATAKGGLQVRVTVISTRTGVIVADVVPTGLYHPDPDHPDQSERESTVWRTGDSGFEKVERRQNGADEGRKVAFALMEQMIPQLTSL
jgi:hypothetical protein